MEFAIWSLLMGSLLILVALAGSVLRRLPLSATMLYLAMGVVVGPWGLALVDASPLKRPVLLERMAEIAVLISLFTAGLKLSPPLSDVRWRLPLRLAVTSMALTVGLIALVAWLFLGLPLGAAVLLGAILAPTDPVLASDVQVHEPGDRDRLRFALTGEGGLNDGTAFPFVMLGLGLLGLHELGAGGWRWVLVDVFWAVSAGLAIGATLGGAIGKLVLYLRREHREAVGLDDFLAMGLIGLAYGAALLVHAYGFLAVFAAGVALRQLEQASTPRSPRDQAVSLNLTPASAEALAVAVDRQHAPAFMAQAVLGFNEQIERIGEVVVVITLGVMMAFVPWELVPWWFIGLVLLVVRPLSTWAGLAGSLQSRTQRRLIGWFGIRGIGSLYYLMYAVNHGLPHDTTQVLVAITAAVVITSILVHGISVTPLMKIYEQRLRR